MTMKKIRSLIEKHNQWREDDCINLIASENRGLPAAEGLYINDMMHRYAEGEPFDRYYKGTKYIDELEVEVKGIIKELFGVEHVDVRPISGTVANMAVTTALKDKGTYFATKMSQGAHLSHSKYCTMGLFGMEERYLPFDNKELQIDPVESAKLINDEDPDFVILGRSLFLFPEPIEELKENITVDTTIIYDAAHVLGLVACGQFQKPFEEGADVLTASTHKTFPGPQGGIIMTNDSGLFKKVKRSVFPGLISNWHSHRLGSLGATAIGMKQFGEEYTRQVVKNAQKLGECLYEKGCDVIGAHKGFTRSHTIALDVSEYGGGERVSQRLEDNNIILNKNTLPGGDAKNPKGIRIGTQEMTMMGMKEGEMEELAELLDRGIKGEEIKEEAIKMRDRFTEVAYSI